MKNKNNFIENVLFHFVDSVFRLPLNMGCVILAILLWFFVMSFTYNSSGNFNLFSTIMNYIALASIASIVGGKISTATNGKQIVNLGIISLLLSIFAIIFFKVMILSFIGYLVICPASFFVFALLLKSLWEGV